jgi:hypothetical protein
MILRNYPGAVLEIGMVRSVTSLEQRVLIAFEQALVEHRVDVADHLLRALEGMAVDEPARSALADAYLIMLPDTGESARD